ncbi:ABC-type polysaccharide transport system, permease component [Bacillus sp. JCM 19046]|nr:ABC-type polysaccharide transport system, permease component [Bacillus sp. JCM 19046]
MGLHTKELAARRTAAPPPLLKKRKEKKKILQNWQLYLFILPAFLYFFIFHYVPLYGVQIAFKDFLRLRG